MYYSATTRGFHTKNPPEDAVAVTEQQRAALFDAQNLGATIEPDANGHPVAVFPTLDGLKALKRIDLDAACREQIYAGFDCDALGAMHHYPANDKDQSNLAGSVLDSVLAADNPEYVTPFWCADAGGVWDFRMHTAIEIQTVGQAAKAAILAALSRNAALQAQVGQAQSQADLDLIVW